MRIITQGEVDEGIRLHGLWLAGKAGGKRANFQSADLRWTDLRDTNLRHANFQGANLRRADFRHADLWNANFEGADLRDADLRRADLQCANFKGANLESANLESANLRWTNLRGCNLIVMQLPDYIVYVGINDTRIDCKHYSNKQWLAFTDGDIEEMGDVALEWWRQYKPVIVAAMQALGG